MKNKILIGAVIILATAFIFENAYLLGRRSKESEQKIHAARHEPLPARRLPEIHYNVPREMVVWDPFEEMSRMQERMNRMAEKNLSEMTRRIPENNVSVESNMNFGTTDTAYVIKVSLPGLDKDTVKIQTKDRQLIISSENKKENTKQDKNYYSHESSYGNFLSRFMLPEDAKIDRIASDYKNGVLTITIPREKVNKSRGSVDIKAPLQ